MAKRARVAEETTSSVTIEEPPIDRHVRAASDVLRLLVGVVTVLLGLLFATGAANTLVGFERDLIGLFDPLPVIWCRLLNLVFQAVASLLPAVVGIVVLFRRKYRLFGLLLLASLLAQLLLWGLDAAVVWRVGPPALLHAVQRPSWVTQAPSDGFLLRRQLRRGRRSGFAVDQPVLASRRLGGRHRFGRVPGGDRGSTFRSTSC